MFDITKIPIKMRNPDSRTDMLKAHVVKQLQHVLEQPNLPLIGRRKIGMTALGAVGQIAGSIPSQERLPQASTRRNNADGPFRNWFPVVNCVYVTRPQDRDGTGNRLQIVDEADRLKIEVQFLCERNVLNHPR